VTAHIGGVPVTVTPTGGGSYFATIVFDDPAFVPSLDGPVAIEVDATDSRTPDGVTRTEAITFVADTDGPVIQVQTPTPGQLVSGLIDIQAQVTDPAGIDSVVATVAQQYDVTLFQTGNDVYSATFDTRQLSTSWVFPLLTVRARDAVGNESAVGRVITLDNRPPLVSMDPPSMREAICLSSDGECKDTDQRECSTLFDPVGGDAADDGELVGELVELRVRTEDRGNGASAPSGVFIPNAGVDPAAVSLYVLDDSDGALLVDTDGDGVCDAINPALVPTTVPSADNETAVVSLVALGPAGNSFFSGNIGAVGGNPEIADGQCIAKDPPADTPPNALCSTAAMTRQIATEFGGLPEIFSIPPTNDPQCAGNAFDSAATNISDGWACVATVAKDTLGNVGVSPPLRICIDADGDGTDANDGSTGTSLTSLGCAAVYGNKAAPGNRPDCTDGCTLPDTFSDFPKLQVHILSTKVP
jgi:Bacterial Ig domain